MPSSLLFAGLVATWLAVLVPMAARRRQQTPRPSDAALSGRVLQRPRRRNQEVTMDDAADGRTGPEAPEPSDRHDPPGSRDDAVHPEPDRGERLAKSPYRPGRGGYDPEAAALAAQAKYTFRQRMVLLLVLFAVISALLAATLRMSDAWYLHAAVDLSLIGYLVYLRRQVRMEQAIRERRAARMAGTRRDHTGGRPRTVADEVAAREAAKTNPHGDERATEGRPSRDHDNGTDTGDGADDAEPEDAGCAEHTDDEPQTPALPRLTPMRLPQPPPGTVRLELDAEDPELHELAEQAYRGYRRAAGQ
ncbi:hypothetical protein [Pseudonocardia spinosispora]|uniref:hypothetical protein n=1 Tax=Pseudonocardia spinosispora TaxID=103441 RepID=UPI00041BA418|nr:hypothetical protein [Pseudonocardia spinosispora]